VIIAMLLASTIYAAPGLYPDPKLTPGKTLDVTAAIVCVPGYADKIRHVTKATRKKVFLRYGIDWKNRAKYEVDHLVSLELGGSNDLENLWPQPYAGVEYTARMKDQAEDWLHRELCKGGDMTIYAAQTLIMRDWIGVYKSCCVGKEL